MAIIVEKNSLQACPMANSIKEDNVNNSENREWNRVVGSPLPFPIASARALSAHEVVWLTLNEGLEEEFGWKKFQLLERVLSLDLGQIYHFKPMTLSWE